MPNNISWGIGYHLLRQHQLQHHQLKTILMPNKRPLYIGAKKLKKKMDNFSVRPQKESHDTLLVILVLIIIENFYYKHTMTN